MSSMTWSQFFGMGGYGLYVWGSFGMCAVVLALEMSLLSLHRRTLGRNVLDTASGPLEADA